MYDIYLTQTAQTVTPNPEDWIRFPFEAFLFCKDQKVKLPPIVISQQLTFSALSKHCETIFRQKPFWTFLERFNQEVKYILTGASEKI